MATIKDIAKAAGVSRGTVSNVLNGKDVVSSDKIQRVMRAVEEMGYSINEKAQNLRKGTANILAVVVPNIYDKPYVDFFVHFKQTAEREGYLVDLYTSNDNPDDERKLISRIRSRMTEAVAAYTAISDGSTPYFDAGFARDEVLFISRKQPFSSMYLGFDMEKAGVEMAQQVLVAGYTRVAMLIGPLNCSSKRVFHDEFVRTLRDGNPKIEIYVRETTDQCRYQNAVRIFSHMQPEVLISENIALARVAQNIYKNFYDHIPLEIYTISPVYSLPESDFVKYEVDYRSLGVEAARCLIERKKDVIEDRILAPKGFAQWPTAPGRGCGEQAAEAETSGAGSVLNILTIGSPTTRALKTVLNLYEKRRGIKIRMTELRSDTMYDLMQNWGPELSYDVIRLDVDWFSWLGKRVFEPLANIEPQIESCLTGFLPNSLKRYSYVNHELYAFPGTPSVQLLFYRKDLFEDMQIRRLYYEQYKCPLEVPESFEAFNRIARFFTKKYNPGSPVPYGCTFMVGNPELAGVEYLIRYFSHEDCLFDADGQIRLNTETARLALQETLDASCCASRRNHRWWSDAVQEFSRGEVAMSLHMTNHVADFVGPDSNVRGKIDWALVPGGNPLLGGSVLGISKYSVNKREALQLLKWISRDDIGTAIAMLGGMSAREAAYDNMEVNDSFPWLQEAKKCFGKSQIHYCPTQDEQSFELRKLQGVIGTAIQEGLSGHIDSSEILPMAAAGYERMRREQA